MTDSRTSVTVNRVRAVLYVLDRVLPSASPEPQSNNHHRHHMYSLRRGER